SCGLRGVPVGARDGRRRRGRGLFAAELVRGARGLVIEEESRLADRRVRARFVARVWAAAQRRANAASAAASPERTQSAMPTQRMRTWRSGARPGYFTLENVQARRSRCSARGTTKPKPSRG